MEGCYVQSLLICSRKMKRCLTKLRNQLWVAGLQWLRNDSNLEREIEDAFTPGPFSFVPNQLAYFLRGRLVSTIHWSKVGQSTHPNRAFLTSLWRESGVNFPKQTTPGFELWRDHNLLFQKISLVSKHLKLLFWKTDSDSFWVVTKRGCFRDVLKGKKDIPQEPS